jgi:hypothetical protein
MTTLTDLTTALRSIDAQLAKAQTEILNRIQALQAALSDVELPPEAEQALLELQTQAQALDDIVPDQP